MNEATRTEFLHLSAAEVWLFYGLVYLSVGYLVFQIFQRVKFWQQGKPLGEVATGFKYWIPTKPQIQRWLGKISTYIVGQKKVKSSRKKSGAPMHLLMFYGFISLVLATTLLAIATYSHKLGLPNFHRGYYYLIYEAVFDVLGLFFLVGVTWAFFRRLKHDKAAQGVGKDFHARKPLLSSNANDYLTLILLFLVGSTGYLLEAGRIAVDPKQYDYWSVVGFGLAKMMPGMSPFGYKGIWWFHMVWVLLFFAVIPRMRIRHIVMAIFATAGEPDHPKGALVPISMEEVEQTGQIGVTAPKDFTRWQLMSLDACMECGRCTEVCPAWNVGKLLNPKQVVQDIRSTFGSEKNVAEVVSEEVLWQCTTCNACVEACPVTIRHVDLIVDLRRNLVAEGKLSGSAAVMLRQTGSTANAWGAPRTSREDWMKGLEIPLARDGGEFEYLFWVGCAGATDPGAIKTTKAVASLLTKAGVSFACLGREEACTGDPARRVGDEFLFQEKAMENAGVFERYKVKKVVTACPHCFNTLKNEYEAMGWKMEVWHHTQLLASLVDKNLLKSASGEGVVIHDPCYLGRVNLEADAPRRLVGETTNYNEHSPDGLEVGLIRPKTLLEPQFLARKTRCCGAGGGRMWMEEPPEQRPSNRRAEELLATGAKTIALGCPFCKIMLETGVKQITDDEEIRLVDLAEMLQEANA